MGNDTILRPMLELSVIIPGAVSCYLPMKEHLDGKGRQIALWGIPVLLLWAGVGGAVCYRFRWDTNLWMLPSLALFALFYCRTITLSYWKTVSVFLAVCGTFSALRNLAVLADALLSPKSGPVVFSLGGAAAYALFCWTLLGLMWYPATHAARWLLDEIEMPGTWYVFWILPIIFILLNFFIIPWNPNILHTGRIMQGYIVISVSLLVLLLIFYALLYFIAKSLNRNNKLAQKNQFLNMQRAQYDALKVAIEETRQARHDMRHHFAVLNALAEQKNWEELEKYLSSASQNIPDTELVLCKNHAVNAIIGHYYSKYKSNGIPFKLKIDIPEKLTVSESDICLVIANLLENAFEASMKLDRDKRQIKMYARPHSEKILLISVENAFNGEITEKDGFFGSSKRNGNGIGTQSVRRIAEKDGGYCRFSHENGIFTADVMLHGKN